MLAETDLHRAIANKVKEVSPQQGEHPLTVAPTSVGLRVSAPSTGWPKSNVSKVRAYCSACDHLIRKIFSGVCWISHWFEEYLKIIEIGDHFFE